MFSVQCSVFSVQYSGFRVQSSGCSVQCSGFRVQGSGFRVQGKYQDEREGCVPRVSEEAEEEREHRAEQGAWI